MHIYIIVYICAVKLLIKNITKMKKTDVAKLILSLKLAKIEMKKEFKKVEKLNLLHSTRIYKNAIASTEANIEKLQSLMELLVY